jgi:gliding motility-associated protein GldM
VQSITDEVVGYMSTVRKTIIDKTGGFEEGSDTKLKGAKDYDMQMSYTLGPEGTKSGEAYKMKIKLDAFVKQLEEIALGTRVNEKDTASIKLDPLALDGKDIAEFAKDPDQKNKDFAQLNFDHTPTVACLAVLSQIQTEIAQREAEVLKFLASKVGADELKFDKIIAVVSPTSRVVAAGTKYEAKMFIAASSSSANPRMAYNGSPVKVEKGEGKIEFTAQGGDYDAEGVAKKSWKGSITIQTPFGDTTFTVTEEYLVAKPVVQVQSASVSALYLNCGNELNIQVPALGSTYDPKFTADAGEVIAGAKKGTVTIVPNRAEIGISVYSSGNLLSVEKFKVKRIPDPNVIARTGSKDIDLKNGVNVAQMPRSITLFVKPDAGFAEFLPKDARYKATEWNCTLARGKRAIVDKKVTSDEINISDMASQAKEGDRIVIEVKAIKRMNFKNQVEDVKSFNGGILTIPIN